MKHLYLIIGPSGVGRTTIQGILEKVWQLDGVHSYTTRPPRAENEYRYRFVSEEQFDALLSSMVEHTTYNGYRYGVTEELLNRADFFICNPAGAWKLAQNVKKPLFAIWLEAGEKERAMRMLKRGDSIDDVYGRIVNDRVDFSDSRKETLFQAIPDHAVREVEDVSCIQAASQTARIMMMNG